MKSTEQNNQPNVMPSKSDFFYVIESVVGENDFSDVDAGNVLTLSIFLPLNYELKTSIVKGSDPEFFYDTTTELLTSDERLLATNENSCVDPCNLGDQLVELVSDFIDQGLINKDGLERDANEFTVMLYQAPDEESCKNATPDNEIYCHGNPIVSLSLVSYSHDQFQDDSFVAEFLIKTTKPTKSCHLDGNIGVSFKGYEALGADIFVEPVAIELS